MSRATQDEDYSTFAWARISHPFLESHPTGLIKAPSQYLRPNRSDLHTRLSPPLYHIHHTHAQSQCSSQQYSVSPSLASPPHTSSLPTLAGAATTCGTMKNFPMACNGNTHVRSLFPLSTISSCTDKVTSGGGIGTTKNRTYWSTEGGAVAFQPGWFKGHETAFLYVNLGYGTDGPDNGPKNMSFPMSPVFQIIGPSNGAYPGTVCLPQVPLPVNASVKAGDKATIQVIEIAQHGAALYSVISL